MMNFNLITACLAIAVTFTSPDAVVAKDNSGKGKGKKDNAIQIDNKPNKGQKALPPGQVKRYTRGAKLPKDLDFDDIEDLSKWNLKAPGKGNRYIRVNDEVLEVSQDLSTVVDTVGIVADLLK